MSYTVLTTDTFEQWFFGLTAKEQTKLLASIGLLEARGPSLPFPHCSAIAGSRHGHMRELRVQVGGQPYRVLYAFDPNRAAILLLGGDKTGDDRWYKTNLPIADDLYDAHLKSLEDDDDAQG